MSNRTIEITVSPTGETKVETKGFTGSSCRDASRLIEQALGQVQSDLSTAEMYLAAENREAARQRAG